MAKKTEELTMKPNVVLIVVDDLGWKDLGSYGSSFYETPNIDGLAAGGVIFTNAYASAPVCSPTRASILTGKYPATVGVTDWIGAHAVGRLCDVPYFSHLPLQEKSLASALRDDGYRTWHVGKWHLGDYLTFPEQHGFDVNVGGCHLGQPPTFFSPYSIPGLVDGPPGEYLTDRLTDEAIALFEQPNDKPFFLNLWHYAVHTPIEAPAALVEKYEQKARSLGLDQADAFEDRGAMPAWHLAGERITRRVVQSDPRYAAMVENLDTNIGRLLDALERNHLTENTLIIFTSDNGGESSSGGSPTSNLPLAEGKGWMYEGGVRVPLIFSGPGVTPGGIVSDAPITSPDLYPTILASAGLPALPEQHSDGFDFSPVLSGKSISRGPLYWHYPHYGNQGGTPAAAVRDGKFKLIKFFEDDHVELYDLSNDLAESKNLASSDPETAIRLSELLTAWLNEINALIPKANPRDDGARLIHG